MTDYWRKAKTAPQSAHSLLDLGDTEGAVNRAYYAMFNAARTILEKLDPDLIAGKTHASVLRHFSNHVVKGGGLDPAHGRALNRAFDARMTSDYEKAAIDKKEARDIVAAMDAFLAAIRPLVRKGRT